MLGNITRREEYDLFAAWLAISLSFAIIKMAPYGVLGPITAVEPMVALTYLVIALLTAGIGLVLHELAHKFAAIKFGFWAEFRKNNFMFLVAVALAALVGFVFAAPGATVIYNVRPDGQGNHPGRKREDLGSRSAYQPPALYTVCRPLFHQRPSLPCAKHPPLSDRNLRDPDQCDDRRLQHAPDQHLGREQGPVLEPASLCPAAWRILCGAGGILLYPLIFFLSARKKPGISVVPGDYFQIADDLLPLLVCFF